MVSRFLFCLIGLRIITSFDVTTYRYDNARSGINSQETILTPTSIKTGFGLQHVYPCDGWSSPQPLIYQNALFIASDNNTFYAYNTTTKNLIWSRHFGPSFIPYAGATCADLPLIGIEGTPVIYPKLNYIYFVTHTPSPDTIMLYALDVATGKTVLSVEVNNALILANGINLPVVFNETVNGHRAGLSFDGVNILVAFGSFCDHSWYVGWFFAFDATTLKLNAVWPSSVLPYSRSEAGIWMSGNTPAIDDNTGSVYLAVGNGKFDGVKNWGNAILRFPRPSATTKDNWLPNLYYEPDPQPIGDQDQGSAGVILATINGKLSAIQGGKSGKIFSIQDIASLTGNISASKNVQIMWSNTTSTSTKMIFESGAFWQNTFYMNPQGQSVLGFPLGGNGLFPTFASLTGNANTPTGGGNIVISANGNQNTIIWTCYSAPGRLYAYNPSDLTTPIYTANLDTPAKFSIPVISNGRVFVSYSHTGVAEYGFAASPSHAANNFNMVYPSIHDFVGRYFTELVVFVFLVLLVLLVLFVLFSSKGKSYEYRQI